MRFAIRVRAARYSLTSALGRGLQIGLPMAAIIVASVPIWGMSWYFDTENWAAGIWNSWAAQRTDTWREAMVRAVVAGGQTTLDGRGFMVAPDGPGRLGAVLVRRHRRHRRGRRQPARAARLADSRRVGRRRAIRRAVVRCRVSHRGDARLRAAILAAVQGRHEAGLRDPGQSRLVRRARRLRGDVLPA